ncbi:MAG: adenylosuccinate lyase, partial [Candidatus Diapherotrites archaeon]|nr:adenylosuccinate lyase [Candidatus Diapherotrites archaeon]
NKQQMKKNLELNKNIIASEALQLLLSLHGYPDAHKKAIELTDKALKENKSIWELAQKEKDLHKFLDKFSAEQKSVLQNPETYLGKSVEKTEQVCEFWKKELGL